MSYAPSQEHLDLYDSFLAETSVDRLQKILARYELFKLAMNVPGHIVECGVFKGSGIYTLAKLQKIFKPNNEQTVVGFDFFEAQRNQQLERPEDTEVLDEHATGWAPQEQILNNLSSLGITNVELIAGDVTVTSRKFAEERLGVRISLLFLDVDNYEGTLACLRNFYPMVSPGGIVVFDEYGLTGYGESDAVDEFFGDQNIVLRSLPWANTPTAYLIKGEEKSR